MDRILSDTRRAKLKYQLALVERHLAAGAAQIVRQRALVAEFERGGYDTKIPRRTVRQFEELQKLHVADRERLRNELALWERSDSADNPLATS